ncbi:MAG: hypothetical protein JXQ99_08010 [Hyphomicrobiaceae bacterium]
MAGLPITRPELVSASIFTSRIAWNAFLAADALLDRKKRTVPVTIANSLTEHDIDWAGNRSAVGAHRFEPCA